MCPSVCLLNYVYLRVCLCGDPLELESHEGVTRRIRVLGTRTLCKSTARS